MDFSQILQLFNLLNNQQNLQTVSSLFNNLQNNNLQQNANQINTLKQDNYENNNISTNQIIDNNQNNINNSQNKYANMEQYYPQYNLDDKIIKKQNIADERLSSSIQSNNNLFQNLQNIFSNQNNNLNLSNLFPSMPNMSSNSANPIANIMQTMFNKKSTASKTQIEDLKDVNEIDIK